MADEPAFADALTTARTAIRRLFEAGLIDEDWATVALLAIHVGLRRRTRRQAQLFLTTE